MIRLNGYAKTNPFLSTCYGDPSVMNRKVNTILSPRVSVDSTSLRFRAGSLHMIEWCFF